MSSKFARVFPADLMALRSGSEDCSVVHLEQRSKLLHRKPLATAGPRGFNGGGRLFGGHVSSERHVFHLAAASRKGIVTA